MNHGGYRPGSGRPHRDTIRIGCSLLRPVYMELLHRERVTGIYQCTLMGRIVTEHLVSGTLLGFSELAEIGSSAALVTGQGPNGAGGQEPLGQMANRLAEFHW